MICIRKILAPALMALMLPLFAKDAVTVTNKGILQVESQRFGIAVWGKNWKNFNMQLQKSAGIEFSGKETPSEFRGDGTLKFPGDSPEIRFTVAGKRISETERSIRYEVGSASGFFAEMLVLMTTFNAENYKNNPALFNGKFLIPEGKKSIRLRSSPKDVLSLPLKNRLLNIQGEFTFTVQPGKNVEIRLFFSSFRGVIRKSVLELYLTCVPYASAPLDLKPVMNMGFRDEKAGDRKGGWTDQGPDNDLSVIQTGVREMDGLPFEIVDPGANDGKSCLAMKGPARPYFCESASVPVPNRSGRTVHLLNVLAWPPAPGTECGKVRIVYDDGSQKEHILKAGIDIGNFWDSRELDNGNVVWRGRNRSSAIGLYRTELPADVRKKIVRMDFVSANQVWMILAATVSERPHWPPDEQAKAFSARRVRTGKEIPLKIAEGADWKKYTHTHGIVPGSIFDFSGLHPKGPAGAFGKVVIRNGHFEFEKRPGKKVRFYGANVCVGGCFLYEPVNYYPERIRQAGFNAVRLHHFDQYLVKPGETLVFDEVMRDRFFQSIAAYKNAGLYITLDLYTMRTRGLPKKYVSSGANPWNAVKILALMDPVVKRNMLDFAKGILTVKNPYTGMTLAEDPALICVGLLNEVRLTRNIYLSPSGLFRKTVNRRYEEWCKRHGETFRPNRDEKQWPKFLVDTYREALDYYREELKKMGVTAPVSQYNNETGLLAAGARRYNDYFDIHWYMAHPNADMGYGNTNPSYSRNVSSVEQYWESPVMAAHQRIAGMPAVVTEYHYCAPSLTRSEGGAVGGAFLALQDFDGMFEFCAAYSGAKLPETNKTMGFFHLLRDPVGLLSSYILNCFYVRGDILPAKQSYYLNLPTELWRDETINGVSLNRTAGGSSDVTAPPEYIRLGAVGKIAIRFKDGKPGPNEFTVGGILEQRNPKDPDWLMKKLRLMDSAGWIRSSNGQIEFQPETGLFRAVTPRSEALVQKAGEANTGKRLSVRKNTTYSTVFAGAIGDGDLETGGRILILHLTDVKESNLGWGILDDQLVCRRPPDKNFRGYPYLIRVGQAEITLKTAPTPGMKLYALNLNGRRLAEIPFRRGKDGIAFTADTGTELTTMAYELIK